MTILELQEEKRELSKRIFELVSEFEDKTNCMVVNISVQHLDSETMGGGITDAIIAGLDIDIRL